MQYAPKRAKHANAVAESKSTVEALIMLARLPARKAAREAYQEQRSALANTTTTAEQETGSEQAKA